MASPLLQPTKAKWRVGMLSLGCPKTLVDSELVLGKLDPKRYVMASAVTHCDLAILNTCSFIQDAQEESIDQILRLVELKKEGEIRKLVVLGCLVQRFPKELQKEFKEVDAFVGSGEYDKIPEIVERVVSGDRVTKIGIPGYLYTSGENRIALTPPHFRYLKISEGCDHTCSFCVIPSFRGRHRSRPFADIVQEAERLAAEGAVELILTGQDTTFFGYDTERRFLLPELLKELNQIPGLHWIRLLYAYPSLVSDKIIESLASLDNVCHYLDMPLQHINDRILKSMKRGTTKNSARGLIKKLRREIPDLSIRTTFIVGYPGETEAEFQELLDFMKESRFDRLGIFTYSAEKGSPAGGLSGQVPQKIKQRRLEAGMLLQQKISEENNRRLIGKTLKVLIEEKYEKPGVWIGRSYMDAPEVDGCVYVHSEKKLLRGSFVPVKMTHSQEYDLAGELSRESFSH